MKLETDESLLRNGSPGAIARLVQRFQGPLLGFLRRLTGDAQRAEDCFQEVFLRLHRSRERYDGKRPLKPYLYRIASNVAHDARRRAAAPLPLASEPASPAAGPAEHAERADSRALIRAAVDALPVEQRAVVWLRVFEEMSFPDIAKIEGIPVATAKSRMVYALRRLRPVLQGCVDEKEPS